MPSKTASAWDTFASTPEDRYSICWASQGIGGSGKSHFLLTAPEPIAVHVFNDPGGIEILKRKPEFRKRDIRWIDYTFNPGKLAESDRSKAAEDELAKFLDNYQTTLKHARTVGWDKEDLVYELLRYARLGGVSDRPSAYYELNLEYRGWFHDAAEAGVNLGVIRGMKEKWGKNAQGKPESTGELVPRGQREVNELVQVVLDHRFDDDQRAFVARIHEKCRLGPAHELIGTEYAGLDFPTLALLLYPETVDTPEVWGL